MHVNAATIQYKPRWGKIAENRAAIMRLLEIAVRSSSNVITLPEMCTTGYVFANPAEIDPYCEDQEGETFHLMANFCRAHRIYLVYGFAEKDGRRRYNSQNLVDPQGRRLATYRKVHLYEQDFTWAQSGNNGFITVDTQIGRLGLGICMDMNFNDFISFHVRQRTDLICFSACWLDEGIEVSAYWLSRLRGYRKAICIANSFGEERGEFFRGQSTVIQGGHVLTEAPLDREAILLTRF